MTPPGVSKPSTPYRGCFAAAAFSTLRMFGPMDVLGDRITPDGKNLCVQRRTSHRRDQSASQRHRRWRHLRRARPFAEDLADRLGVLLHTGETPRRADQDKSKASLPRRCIYDRFSKLHSVSAAAEVLNYLAAQPIQGAVLHWWLGDALRTAHALKLGCYFSVNSHMLQRQDLVEQLPLDRVLAETDHPFGDRANGRAHRPGRVDLPSSADWPQSTA
jgi:hypothetical protein